MAAPEEVIHTEAGQQPELPVGAPQTESTTTSEEGAPSTHYKTLEAADEAARRFQGERDRLEAEMRRITRFAPIEQLEPLLETLNTRDDLADYLRGDLRRGTGSNGATPSNDEEFLTDEEQRARGEITNLSEQLKGMRQSFASMQFAQINSTLDDRWGDLLKPYQDQAMTAFQRVIASGSITDFSKIGPQFVETLYLQQVPWDERPALYRAQAQLQESRNLSNQQARGTTVPKPERPSDSYEGPPKNLAEAMERGLKDVEARRTRGA